MGLANIAKGNTDAPRSQRQQQQATLARTPIVNTHETHQCILPMSLRWSVPKLPISQIENWRETVKKQLFS